MRLLTEEALAAIGAPCPSADGIAPERIADTKAGQSLRAFLTVTASRDLFIERGWSPEAVFYSRYYWFRRFVHLRVAESGSDAGLEQQSFQILECPLPECDPDWAVVKKIESLAVAHASSQLGRGGAA